MEQSVVIKQQVREVENSAALIFLTIFVVTLGLLIGFTPLQLHLGWCLNCCGVLYKEQKYCIFKSSAILSPFHACCSTPGKLIVQQGASTCLLSLCQENQGWCFIPFAKTGGLVSVHTGENSKRVFFSILVPLFLGRPVCASLWV